MEEKIGTILKKYINERIPRKSTNIFWLMFNGIEAVFSVLEHKLLLYKRESNILTAQNKSSLRNLSANNGFEPKLKLSSKGLLLLKVNSKSLVKYGYPLFITPYSNFIDKTTKINYQYVGNSVIKIYNENVYIPVIEGEIKTVSVSSTGATIERVYLEDENICDNSISVEINNINFIKVDSFFDNEDLNGNNQFLVKFSNNSQTPIIIYVKNSNINDTINISYRLTLGELGNIEGINEFETESIIDNNGNNVIFDVEDISILNINGFDFGSDGTNIETLRSAIGYNHGINILFDNISYSNFLKKYSNVFLQNIGINEKKTINNIYISKRIYLNTDTNINDLIFNYSKIKNDKLYLFSNNEKINLSTTISEFEYCMSSHNIYDSVINNFAFQIKFKTIDALTMYSEKIKQLLYIEFSKFLSDKYSVNIDLLFENFMKTNNVLFEYTIFNEEIENKKIDGKKYITPNTISNETYLPILNGNFNLIDKNLNKVMLFFDINIVSEI